MKLPINELSSGMIIGEDIHTSNGSLIINKGFVVKNAALIKNILNQNNISSVEILSEDTSSEESELQRQVNLSIHEEIQNFHDDFQDHTAQINSQIIKVSSGDSNTDFFYNFLDKAVSSSKENRLNIFQLMQKTKTIDDLTFSHCYAVSLTANELGEWLGLKGPDLKELTLAALLSDVGKSVVPHNILFKEEPLSDEERTQVEYHVIHSLELLENLPLSDVVRSAIRSHHEKTDGSGYPDKLKGDEIPYFARIIAVADIYVALTSKRPYRRIYTPFEAMQILESNYLDKLDVSILTTFLKRISDSYVGNPILLSNGQTGTIVFMTPRNYLRPVVKIDGENKIIDLSLKENESIHIAEFN